jgi:Zn-dependent M32 family carboxypeptidase
MSYDGPNQPVTPLADPYDAYRKLYGNVREKKQVRSVLEDLRGDLNKVANQLPESDRKLLIEHTQLVNRMDQEYANGSSLSNLTAKPPELP